MKKSIIKKFVVICLMVLLTGSLAGSVYSQSSEYQNSDESIPDDTYEIRNVTKIPIGFIKLTNPGIKNLLAVDKSGQRLELYEYDGSYHLVKTFLVTTGKKAGNKKYEGDEKTPEGVYFFNKIRESEDIVKMYGKYVAKQYGVRAFDITFPSGIDRIFRRGGSGIWLHGTDEPSRIGQPRVTRGCVVLKNEDIEYLSNRIILENTPIIISEKIEYYSNTNQYMVSSKIESFLENWRLSWQNRNYESYSKSYSEKFRNKGRSKKVWLDYKKYTLDQYAEIDINFSNIDIFKGNDYYYVQFEQNFETNSYSDLGKKVLYIIEDGNDLKILREDWVINDQSLVINK